MQAGEEMPRSLEPPVDADRGAAPGGPAAGEILVTRVRRETRAALEQATLREGFAPLARPGGRRKLLLRLGEQRVGCVKFVELFERVCIQAPHVLVRRRAPARVFEERQRLPRPPERDERLRLAEEPVDVRGIVREQHVVLLERGVLPSRACAGSRERVAGVGVIRLCGDGRLKRRVTGERHRRREHGSHHKEDSQLQKGTLPSRKGSVPSRGERPL